MPLLVSDIMYAAARISGLLPVAGRAFSPSESSDILKTLNSMVDSWKAERLLVWAILRTEFNVVASQEFYYVGTAAGADWVVERPEQLEAAGFIYNNVTPALEQPLRILSDQEWELVQLKKLPSTIANYIYYRPTVPNGQAYLWPIPSTGWKVALYTWRNVNQFATVGDTITVPPAYQEAMEYNLARMISMRFPLQTKISPLALQVARDSKMKIKAINTPSIKLVTELGALGRDQSRGQWNIFTGQYNPIN